MSLDHIGFGVKWPDGVVTPATSYPNAAIMVARAINNLEAALSFGLTEEQKVEWTPVGVVYRTDSSSPWEKYTPSRDDVRNTILGFND